MTNSKYFNIRSVFESECEGLKFDKKLAKAMNAFVVGFVNKNEEHLTFFGGHTTGVQIVRFTPADKNTFFEILGINDWSLEEKLLDLPSINKNWIVSSDAFNQTCMFITHKFMTTPLLSTAEKKEAAVDCVLALYFKFITSLLSHYFRFPANKEEAEAAYAMLSGKFLLKQYGSWYATFRARAEDLVAEHNIWHKTLTEYNDDREIVLLINDTQGRLRDMFKNIYAMVIHVNNHSIKVTKTSSVVEHDGEMMLKDKTKSLAGYIRYIATVAIDENSFIKEELMSVISGIMHTMPPKLLTQTLQWCSANYMSAGAPEVKQLMELTLVHSFSYLADHKTILSHENDLPGLISKLRGVYMSSRSTDVDLMKIRDLGQDIVRKSTKSKNDSILTSVRTGLLLYIVLRAYTMHHYANA